MDLPEVLMRVIALAFALSCALVFAGPTVTVGNQGIPVTYTAGTLEEFSAGAEGKLSLGGDSVAFSSGKNLVLAPYKQILNVELGEVIETPRKGLALRKKKGPTRRQMTLEYTDAPKPPAKGDAKAEPNSHSATFEMDDDDATAIVEEIELRTGRRRRITNGDHWWGDSAWKTKRNDSVKPDAIGNLEK
jgi:hypothetical protein